MNIILIGMRGSGKNTIGILLAKKLNKNFIDVDQLIVSKEGMLIKNFVEKFGWHKFRELETSIMKRLALTKTDAVIATGGGVVENRQNLKCFQDNHDVIIWLKCSIETIIDRIGNNTTIPIITDADNFVEDLRAVYKTRKKLYQKFADIMISSEEEAKKAAINIIAKLKERNLI